MSAQHHQGLDLLELLLPQNSVRPANASIFIVSSAGWIVYHNTGGVKDCLETSWRSCSHLSVKGFVFNVYS